jgi:prevent-host-death family protein
MIAMKRKATKRSPEIVMRAGKPKAVILDIDEYREILERLEDLDDLRALEELRKRPLCVRSLDEYLLERRGV